MSDYSDYLLEEVRRLVRQVMEEEALLKTNLLPFARKAVQDRLSYLRKHINGMCQVARRAGATSGMIQEALKGESQ